MKYNFWKDIKEGDLLYYYDTDNWTIGHFYIKCIKDKSIQTGSFIIETDCDKHKYIYVNTNRFFYDEIIDTWNHTTSKQLFINTNKYELINDLKDTLKKKISELKNNVNYYEDLLNRL